MSKIKELRKRKGISQRTLAHELNIGQTAVSMWENGTNFPKAEMLPKLAKILNCSIDELFDKAE